MTNYNTKNMLLTYDDLLNENDRLKAKISNLEKEKEEYSKCTATVYDPNRMTDQKTLIEAKIKYAVLQKDKEIDALKAELEEKISIIEQEKNTAVDRLADSMSQLNKELQELKNKYYKLQEDDLYLKKRIKDQDAIIHLAAGYISSTPQFSKEHPMNVLSWLKGVTLP